MKKDEQRYLIMIGVTIIIIFILFVLYKGFTEDEVPIKNELEYPKIVSPVSGNLGDKLELETFQVEFDQPVYNLKASDLTINGVSAKNVVGSGAGPYIFYGFSVPDKRDIKIVLEPGDIKNKIGRDFTGDSWTLRLFKYNGDDDGDRIINSVEIENGADPTKKDTDGDGMDDNYEINNNKCLDPKSDDSQADPDNDGIKNYQEFRGGTSPCI